LSASSGLYRAPEITPDWECFGVAGARPCAHSLSPALHNVALAGRQAERAVYLPLARRVR
jgi:shikimate 5-dehydrogenase